MDMLTENVYDAVQIRELEFLACQRLGITAGALMERAAKAVLACLTQHWPSAKRITILCGTGNNGGDGYVVAMLAHKIGKQVTVLQVGDARKLKDIALESFQQCKNAGVNINPFTDFQKPCESDVIVDAIYGIGLHDDMPRDAKTAVEWINKNAIPVLSIDVPTGINASTGAICPIAVHATVTLTFIGLKAGLLMGDGVSYVGELICDELEIPSTILSLHKSTLEKVHLAQFAEYFKPRLRNWHKGNAGHVVIIGGASGLSGAPRMAAEAALRVGAGLVTVVTHPKNAAMLNIMRPEIMCQGIRLARTLQPILDKATVVVIGPGLGQSLWAKQLLQFVLKTKLPLVIDADALNLLALNPATRHNWVLTPHPGEAARLLNQTNQDVQKNRLAALTRLQHTYDGVCVLKGAGSLISAPHHQPAICTEGNPGMATAGMGDVLSGVIGGLIAQGIPLPAAARVGVCLHAFAGDLAAKEGERGMIATDLMPYLRQLVNFSL